PVPPTSSPGARPRSGASAPPPIPRDGGRSPPCCAGRLAGPRRPALRGALRLVGFASEGTRPLPHPASAGPRAAELRFGEGADVFGEAVEEGEVVAGVAHAGFEQDGGEGGHSAGRGPSRDG